MNLLKTSIFMSLIISFLFINSFAQTTSLGVGLCYAPTEISKGAGLNGLFEFRPDVHYAYRMNLRAVLGSFENSYYPGTSYLLPGLEGAIIYYPVKWPIEPYLGAGVGYIFPVTTGPDGNSRETPDGSIVGNNIKSSYALNIIAGFKLSADTPVSLLLEFKYNYFRPNVTHEFSSPVHHFKEEKVEWSSVITSLGVIFRI